MIISRTPLRVSLFGGGSDFPQFYQEHGGAVLTTAIDKYIYVIVKKRFDDKIVLHYTKNEICDSVDQIKHDYIREAMRMCGVDSGVEVITMADVPSEGTGLGSSSSLAVGLLKALTKYKHEVFNMRVGYFADIACTLELDILKKNIGIQDQYIAAYGGLQYITFDSEGPHICTHHEDKLVNRFTQQRESIKTLESNLMLFYTGITRSAHCVLREQVENTDKNIYTLKEMVVFALMAQKILEEGDVDRIGVLLHESWCRKTKLSSTITNPEIDIMYSKALKNGALGGKICGAGGGGFMLLYVPEVRQDDVRQALAEYKELPFKFEPEGSKIIYG